MSDETPLQAFRTITVPFELLGGKVAEVRIPFDVELLERVEETVLRCEDYGWHWLRLKRSQKSIIAAYRDFCAPYLPGMDLRTVDPSFLVLFFSHVRVELERSMTKSFDSTPSTAA